MITQYSGKERGVMFLPEIGDEVVVAFENGDPERPVVLGSLWNGKDLGPRNPYRNQDDIKQNEVKRIITKSGNTIEIIDTSGKEVIDLYTAKKECSVQLNNENKTITVHSEKDIISNSPENIKESSMKITMDAVDEINEAAGKKIKINAGVELYLEGPGGSIKIDASGVTIQGVLVKIN